MLAQTYTDFELICVDDGSIDNTVSILKKYEKIDSRIKLFFNGENRGLPYTRNRMFELCTGEYIAIIDSDDIMPIYRLERGVEILDAHRDLIAVGGGMQLIGDNGEYYPSVSFAPITHGAILARMLIDCSFVNGSMLLRRSMMIEGNLRYDDRFPCMQDYKFWTECVFKGRMTNVNQIMLYYRIRDNSVTFQSKKNREKRAELYDLIHYEYVNRLCNSCLNPKEMKIYLQQTQKACFDEKESSIIKRLVIAVKFQRVLSKLYDNCQYKDDDFGKELADIIDIYSSKAVHRVLKMMRLVSI